MATVQKQKRTPKLERSAREKGKRAAHRPTAIKRARRRHLKNARRSCGEAFAAALKEHYDSIPNPGKRVHVKRFKHEQNG